MNAKQESPPLTPDITVYAPSTLGDAGRSLADRFAGYVRRQFPTAQVSVKEGHPLLSVSVTGPAECGKTKASLELQAQVYNSLERLSWYVADLDAKRKIAVRLVEELRNNRDGIKFAPTFFRSAIEAFWLDVVISLARLFERKRYRNQSVNIRGLLEFIRMHFDALPQFPKPDYRGPSVVHVEPLTRDDLDRHLNLLDEFEGKGTGKLSEPLVEKLMHYRDKMAAHNDNCYFFDSSKYPAEMRLMAEDVEKLVREAKSILEQCWLAFMGTGTEMEFSTANDVERVLERLESHRRFVKEYAAGKWKKVDPEKR
jgi:hypothetical protein